MATAHALWYWAVEPVPAPQPPLALDWAAQQARAFQDMRANMETSNA